MKFIYKKVISDFIIAKSNKKKEKYYKDLKFYKTADTSL